MLFNTIAQLSLMPMFLLSSVQAAENDRGNYTVDGLGSRKDQILNNGGSSFDMAIAMLETENLGTDYTYGDGKTKDSANFGIFKQNWGMLREATTEFAGQSESDWNNGAVLNSNLQEDIQTRHEAQDYYGYDKWVSGHRNGASGLADPMTPDIQNYSNAINWINEKLSSDEKYLHDDTRFWVDIHAI